MRARGAVGIANVVTFEVAEVLYALDIQRIEGIIKPLPVHKLAHLPPNVVGVADHRGDVVPVVDLRRRFGAPALEDDRSSRWIVVHRGARRVAFVVDRVIEVSDTARLEARATPELGSGDETRGIVAAHARAGQLVFVVDADLLAAAALGLDSQLLRIPAVAPTGEHGAR